MCSFLSPLPLRNTNIFYHKGTIWLYRLCAQKFWMSMTTSSSPKAVRWRCPLLMQKNKQTKKHISKNVISWLHHCCQFAVSKITVVCLLTTLNNKKKRLNTQNDITLCSPAVTDTMKVVSVFSCNSRQESGQHIFPKCSFFFSVRHPLDGMWISESATTPEHIHFKGLLHRLYLICCFWNDHEIVSLFYRNLHYAGDDGSA